MKKKRYRIYLNNNKIILLSGSHIDAIREVAEQIATEQKTFVLSITPY